MIIFLKGEPKSYASIIFFYLNETLEVTFWAQISLLFSLLYLAIRNLKFKNKNKKFLISDVPLT